jgi:excisionase family DNA binding protein
MNARATRQAPDRLLTRAEVADHLRLSERTITTMIATGEIKAIKVRNMVRIRQSELDRLLREAESA